MPSKFDCRSLSTDHRSDSVFLCVLLSPALSHTLTATHGAAAPELVEPKVVPDCSHSAGCGAPVAANLCSTSVVATWMAAATG